MGFVWEKQKRKVEKYMKGGFGITAVLLDLLTFLIFRIGALQENLRGAKSLSQKTNSRLANHKLRVVTMFN